MITRGLVPLVLPYSGRGVFCLRRVLQCSTSARADFLSSGNIAQNSSRKVYNINKSEIPEFYLLTFYTLCDILLLNQEEIIKKGDAKNESNLCDLCYYLDICFSLGFSSCRWYRWKWFLQISVAIFGLVSHATFNSFCCKDYRFSVRKEISNENTGYTLW